MRSPGSQSLAHESLVSILSHLPSHRLHLPWEEIMIVSLGRLPHFLFPLPFRVIFFTDLSTFTRIYLVTALIRIYFPAHGTSSFEAARDDIMVDSSAPASIVLSGFDTDLAIAGPCMSFNTWLLVCIGIFIFSYSFYRLRGWS
jgi:hypothetical protein